MAKFIKNNSGNFLVTCFILLMVTAWIFSGWPRIWQRPPIPPEIQKAWAITDTYTTAGAHIWTAPSEITLVDVEVWGGGGAGGGNSTAADGGGGGGGGGYSKKTSITVIPSTEYTVTVGAAGAGVLSDTGGAGGDSWFINNTTVLAKGGAGGAAPIGGAGGIGGVGGASVDGIGNIKYSGGTGGTGRNNPNGNGGPGGGSAGTASDGNSGLDPWDTLTATEAVTGGGPGGAGGDKNLDGDAPLSGPGGGGGGSGEGTQTGGAGWAGQVKITYGVVTVSIIRTVGDGIVSYGNVDLSGTKNTGPGDLGDVETYQNDGGAAELFRVKTSTATGGVTPWTVGSAIDTDVFVHSFATTTGLTWQILDVADTYETASSSVAVDATVDFYFKIDTPSGTSVYDAKTITVNIQAIEAP